MRSIQHFLQFREKQETLLNNSHHGCKHAINEKLELGDVITLNLTMLKSGVTADNGKTYAYNVVPMEAEVNN
jgi:hypothetical protein